MPESLQGTPGLFGLGQAVPDGLRGDLRLGAGQLWSVVVCFSGVCLGRGVLWTFQQKGVHGQGIL